jgi:putative transposase
MIRRSERWRGADDVELATLEWVDSYNHQRLHSYCAGIPPAEFEVNSYRQIAGLEALQPGEPSRH